MCPGKPATQEWLHEKRSEPWADSRTVQPMREPGALRRLLQMKSFLDLEQPSDADAPGEFGRSFEANDGTLDRNDVIRPAWAPIGIDKVLRIVRAALETYVWMQMGRAWCRARVCQYV